MDVWELIALAHAGKLDELRGALDDGAAANASCEHTGMTPLLAACEEGQIECTRLLLQRGADPNHTHYDGFNAYDSSSNREIQALLLDAGFSLTLESKQEARGLRGWRVLAPREPQAATWAATVAGDHVEVQWQLHTLPAPRGRVAIHVTDSSGTTTRFFAEAGTVGHWSGSVAGGSTASVTATLQAFVGDVRVRIYDRETLAGNEGPLSFWLPAWE